MQRTGEKWATPLNRDEGGNPCMVAGVLDASLLGLPLVAGVLDASLLGLPLVAGVFDASLLGLRQAAGMVG